MISLFGELELKVTIFGPETLAKVLSFIESLTLRNSSASAPRTEPL
jgi:hypothetical protein